MRNTLSNMLQKARQLNIPCQNSMKINQELEKTIVDTQHKYKDNIFLNVTLTFRKFLNELRKQQAIDERVHNQKVTENAIKQFEMVSGKKIIMHTDMMIKKR